MSDVVNTKPIGNSVVNNIPVNKDVLNIKPSGIINDKNFNQEETVDSVLTVGAYMGIPVLTYTVAGTVTFTQPRGGRAG